MKSPTANKYKNEQISKIRKKYGGFYAFSDKQFEEARDKKVEKYVHITAGLFAPKEHADQLVFEMSEAIEKAIEIDKAENSERAIVEFELKNHEAHISRSVEATADALKGYDIDTEFIREVYNDLYKHRPFD